MKKLMSVLLVCHCAFAAQQPVQVGYLDAVKAKVSPYISYVAQAGTDTYNKVSANPAEACGHLVLNTGLYVAAPYGITYAMENTERGQTFKDAVFYDNEYKCAKYGLYSLSAVAAAKKFGIISESAANTALVLGFSGLVLSKLMACGWNKLVPQSNTTAKDTKTVVKDFFGWKSSLETDTSKKMEYGLASMAVAVLAYASILK